jgi:hypothetical protein
MIDGGLPEGIIAESLVVVEVFVAAGDAEDALGQQAALGVGDEVGVAAVGQGVVQGVKQTKAAVGLTREQNPCVGRENTPGQVGPFGTGKG